MRIGLTRAFTNRMTTGEPQTSGRERVKREKLAAYIAEGTCFFGDLHCTQGIAHIDGAIVGSIFAGMPSMITLGRTAVIQGDIAGDHVEVRGRIVGNIRASCSVVLHDGAQVTGEIYCRLVALKSGAIIVGQLHQRDDLVAARGAVSNAAGDEHIAIMLPMEKALLHDGGGSSDDPAKHARQDVADRLTHDKAIQAAPVPGEPCDKRSTLADIARAFLAQRR